MFDLVDGQAEFGRKVRAQYKDAEFDERMRGKLTQLPVELAMVGARGRHHADAPPFCLSFTHACTCGCCWLCGTQAEYKSLRVIRDVDEISAQ